MMIVFSNGVIAFLIQNDEGGMHAQDTAEQEVVKMKSHFEVITMSISRKNVCTEIMNSFLVGGEGVSVSPCCLVCFIISILVQSKR